MKAHRNGKRIDRQAPESFATERARVLNEFAAILGRTEEATATVPARVEAAVLMVKKQAAVVRILGDEGRVTFRSGDVGGMPAIVPGHLVTLVVERRWRYRGDAYASGWIERPRIDVAKLELVPLPLEGGELEDFPDDSEHKKQPDAYSRLRKKRTSRVRPSFEFDGIAWGALPGFDVEHSPTCEAAELAAAGDRRGARELLMETLGIDLRCIDAHAHLGNLLFDRSPERAMIHYEVGIRIGELSLPEGFDGYLVWGRIHNRPFLRCLHGYALCLWRLDRFIEAKKVFERILSLNPSDNQGVRFCWEYVRKWRSWKEMQEDEVR